MIKNTTPLSSLKLGGEDRGFTLLELLISIGIVGVLASIAVFSYTQITKASRDSRRRTDIEAISQAVDQYFLAHDQTYPSPNCSGISDYFETKTLPVEPSEKDGYAYDLTGSCGASQYCICARMEVEGSGNAIERADDTCNYGGDKSYFCVSSKQ